jgi:hypothetical protein
MPIYLIDPGDQIEAASWEDAEKIAAQLGAVVEGELVEEVVATADDFEQYRKAVPKLSKGLVRAADQIQNAVERAGTIKKISSVLNKALKEARKAFESLAEPSPFGSIRPGIINAIEIWRNGQWGPEYQDAKDSLVKIEGLVKEMRKDSRNFDSLRVRTVEEAGKVRRCGEAALKAMPKMADVETVPKVFKLGPFTVLDEYGVPENLAEAWFEAIRYTVKLLKQKGLDYLCYGNLELTLGVGPGGAWSGLYSLSDDKVSLSLSRQQTQVMRSRWKGLVKTFVHELGHRCWFKFMDAGQRDSFSAPWIEQDVMVRDMREKVWKVWEIPVKEREQAFKVAWDSGFDSAAFRKWLKQDPLRSMRWLRWLEFVYPRGTDYVHGPLAQKGKLFGKSWSELKKQLAYTQKRQGDSDNPGYYDSYLAKVKRSNYDEWVEPKEGYERYFSENALKWAYEPDTGGMGKHPIAEDIQKSLKLAKIEPSVTDYGNTNRREDFAESFSAVVTGKEKSREIQMRVQRALPKGRVVSSYQDVAAFLRRRGYGALASLLESDQ